MDEETAFMVFCIEKYKTSEKLSGKQVIALFKKYGVLGFLTECYGALHTTPPEYIVEDIKLCIAARQ